MLFIMSLSLEVLSAAYNTTDSYINVPIAKQYRLNEIQFGMSHAYNGSASIQEDEDRYEMDFKTVYAINNNNQVANVSNSESKSSPIIINSKSSSRTLYELQSNTLKYT